MLDYSPFFPLEELDVEYFKTNYLTGFEFFLLDNQPIPDSWYESRLQNALGTLEELTGVDVLERSNIAEKHDYHANDYLNYGYIQLFRIPAQSVSEVRATFPTGVSVQVFPSDWVRLEKHHSMLQLVPSGGTLTQMIIGRGGYYPFVWFSSYLPHLWSVDYVSGFDLQKIPRIIIDALAKLAALDALAILSNFVHPLGVSGQSLSVDGLSQSRSFSIPAFRAQMDAYKADLYGIPGLSDGLIKQIRNSFFGVQVLGA